MNIFAKNLYLENNREKCLKIGLKINSRFVINIFVSTIILIYFSHNL